MEEFQSQRRTRLGTPVLAIRSQTGARHRNCKGTSKSMKLELHIIQSFAPSNLNRDDTGSPKDCEFGGVRRARISSQCWKRAMRLSFAESGFLPPENRSERSRKLAAHVAKLLKNENRT